MKLKSLIDINADRGVIAACLIKFKAEKLSNNLYKLDGVYMQLLKSVGIVAFYQSDTTYFLWNGKTISLCKYINRDMKQWYLKIQKGYKYSTLEALDLLNKWPDAIVECDQLTHFRE